MKLIAVDLLAEKLVMSENETEAVLGLLDFSSTDVSLLSSARAAMFPKLELLSRDLAQKAMQAPQMKQMITELSTPEDFPKSVRDYMRDYFGGACDEKYIETRAKAGALYYRFDIQPKLFIPMTSYMQQILEVELIQALGKTDTGILACRSLSKFVRLDNMLIMQAFDEARQRGEAETERKRAAYSLMLERKVARLTQAMEDLSQKDPLTGLYNARGLFDNLYREIGNAKRHKWGICLVYFDFNGFREFNETEGRRVGDKLLNIMAATLTDAYRETDIICRYKDDQFCVIMPNTVAADARKVCKRVIDKFRQRSTYGLAFCMGLAQTGPKEFLAPDDFLYVASENVKIAQGAISDKSEFFLKG